MKLLARSQIRFLLRVPWSALTALFGVMLGVASVVAVHQISVGVDGTLRETTPPHLAGVTHLLRRDELDADAYFDLRASWRRGEVPAIEAMLPVVEGHVVVNGTEALLVGADWLALADLDYVDEDARRPAGALAGPLPALALLAGRQAIVDSTLGLQEGESLTLGGRSFGVAGVVNAGMGPVLFADIAAVQSALALSPEAVSYVGAAVVDPWRGWRSALERLMPGISAALPEPEVPAALAAGWEVHPVSRELPGASFARSILFNLGALGTLALLVAWFLIYQFAVIWLRRQRMLVARLIVLGVRPGEFLRGFLPGFAALGVLATVLGVALGQILTLLLIRVTAAGLPESIGAPAPDVWVLGKAVISGVGGCLVGGWAAFQREAAEAWHGRGRRGRLAIPAAGLLAAAVGYGAFVEASGLSGGFLSILALSLLGVMAVGSFLGGFRRLSRRLGGRLLLRTALREAAWYPRVVAVALAALALAVATSIAVGLMVESFRLDFSRMLDMRLSGDLYVRGAPRRVDEARRWLADRPDVERLNAYGRSRQRVGGVPVELSYGRYDASELRRYGLVRASDLGDEEIVISERLSRQIGAEVGDRIDVAGSASAFEVVHIFPGFGDPVPRALVNLRAAAGLGVHPVLDRLTVSLAAGSELASKLGRRFARLEVQRRAEIRTLALQIFDRTFAATQALTLLALTVAAFGMYNALTALRLTQAPTLRLLVYQGVTPAELRGLGLVRALTLGGLALVLALPLGLAMAWVLCEIINPRAFGWSIRLHLPASGWLPPLVLGLAAAVLAGLLPAPREQGELDDAG